MNQPLSRLMPKISNPGSGVSRSTKSNPKEHSWILGVLIIPAQTKFCILIIYTKWLEPFIQNKILELRSIQI